MAIDDMLESRTGKVPLLRPRELSDLESKKRAILWDVAHHLVRVLDMGEIAAAELVAKRGLKEECIPNWPVAYITHATEKTARQKIMTTTRRFRASPESRGWQGKLYHSRYISQEG